ncbi:DUF551 domain-containing protein [Enterobacter mori]|uniref:DUF551 domain-containing protein n=1 Tax=Enterobacter mori TaxID=539813 RepID=UPI0032AF09DF
MNTITKQWLQQKISGMEATRDEIPFGLGEDDSNTLAALRIALASLEAEPVADERAAFEAFMEGRFKDSIDRKRVKNGDQGYLAWDMIVAWIVWQGRAAMLQGAKNAESPTTMQTAPALDSSPKIAEPPTGINQGKSEPVTTANKLPDGWVACSERMPEIGLKVLCFPVNDEPIHATYNGQVWLQDISWSTSDEPIDNVISCNVFHWMPLPAAPQQEAE